MFGRRRDRREEPERSGTGRGTPRRWVAIGDECEAFLSGTYAELFADDDDGAPSWAQLNRLAHGSFEQIEGLTKIPPGDANRVIDATWGFTLSRLGRQLLLRAPDPASLRRLQARALWPLESELISSTSELAESPGALFRLVVAALGDRPTEHEGAEENNRS